MREKKIKSELQKDTQSIRRDLDREILGNKFKANQEAPQKLEISADKHDHILHYIENVTTFLRKWIEKNQSHVHLLKNDYPFYNLSKISIDGPLKITEKEFLACVKFFDEFDTNKVEFEKCKFLARAFFPASELSFNECEFSGFFQIPSGFSKDKLEFVGFQFCNFHEPTEINSNRCISIYEESTLSTTELNGDMPILMLDKSQINDLRIGEGSLAQKISILNSNVLNFEFKTSKNNNSFFSKNTTYELPPDFTHFNSLKPDSDFVNCKFTETSIHTERRYSVLKTLFRLIGAEALATQFHSLEMKSRYENLNWWMVEKYVSLLHWGVNDYGYSFLRPLLWIAVVWLILFSSTYINECNIAFTENSPLKTDSQFWEANIFASQSISGPFRILFAEQVVAKKPIALMMSSIGTVISTLLWYLLVIGIRKRFKI